MAKDKNGNDVQVGDDVLVAGVKTTVRQIVTKFPQDEKHPELDRHALLVSVDGVERQIDATEVERA